MKAKNIFNLMVLCLAGASILSSCKGDDDYAVGEWDAVEGYQDAGFAVSSVNEEKDPSDATTTSFVVTRAAGEGRALPACVLPLEVVENTDNVFEVGECRFAEGADKAEVTVNFPKAEMGKNYSLTVKISDPKFVSSYSENIMFTYNVIRVKWNRIGGEDEFATFAENFWWEESSRCVVEQRDDDPTQFRLKAPFDNMPGISGYLNGRQNETIVFRILQKGEGYAGTSKVASEGLVVYDDINLGYFHTTYNADIYMYHPSAFTSMRTEENWKFNRVLSWQDEKHTLPGQVQFAPYYYMDGIGGWNHTQADGVVVITFPGYTPLYEASIEEDFDWEPVFSGDYASEQLRKTSEATLYHGVCVTDKDNCAERFAEKNGELYMIASPYAEDYHILFAVKDDKVSIPEGYEMQPIGLSALGEDVYASISAARSKFSKNVVELYMIFSNEDGSKTYGEAIETLSNITYTTVGTADYVYTFFFTDEEENPVTDYDLELQQRDDKPEMFRLLHWGYDVDFYFTWNQKTNAMTVPANYIGYDHPSYGPVFVADWATVGLGSYAQYPCAYDPETKTATLNVNYFVSAGSFGGDAEYMQIKLGEMPEPVAAARKAKAKKNFNIHQFELDGSKKMWKVVKNQAPVRITKESTPVAASLAE